MRSITALVSVLAISFPLLSNAQATRTWVSGVGDDLNPGSRTAPCLTFAGVISKTAPGGVIDVLDPGDFGPVTVTKSITIDGDADGVNPGTAHHAKKFLGPHDHRIFRGAGHNLPQERPEQWACAVIDARKMAASQGTKQVIDR